MSRFQIEFVEGADRNFLHFHGYAVLSFNGDSPEAVRNFIREQLHNAVDNAVDALQVRTERIEI